MTLHSFSFGHHYDPTNLAFGPLRAFDDHDLQPGAGFDKHRHSAIELVTWVQSGTLVHTGEEGVSTSLPAGSVQAQGAGSGILHTERAADDAPARFIQSWLVPDDADMPPRRSASVVDPAQPLRPVAGAGTDVPVGTAGATLWQGTVPAASFVLPACRHLHLFVLAGEIDVCPPGVTQMHLTPGDAVRVTFEEDDDRLSIHASPGESAQILAWTFQRPSPR